MQNSFSFKHNKWSFLCDKIHSFFIKSSSKYTLIYSSSVLVKIISCFTTDLVELSPVPHYSRASTSLINNHYLYVRRVEFLGEEDQYNNWLDPFCAWIKALYMVKILLMTMCLCPNSYVFLILNTILICAKYVSFPSTTV